MIENKQDREDFMHICDITTKLLDLPRNSISMKLRDRPLVLARQIAGNVGLEHGIHKNIIARILNKDRTSIMYYERKHKVWFEYYAPYRNNYLKVLETYRKTNDEKKQFIDRLHLKHFVKNLGLKNSNDPDVVIIINSGDVQYKLLSDCFRFSDDMKTLHNALNKYKYKINFKSYEN